MIESPHGRSKVLGSSCEKGRVYGRQEVVDPRRVFFTTVPVAGDGGWRVAVLVSNHVPKNILVEAAAEIHKFPPVPKSVKIGDVVPAYRIHIVINKSSVWTEDS